MQKLRYSGKTTYEKNEGFDRFAVQVIRIQDSC